MKKSILLLLLSVFVFSLASQAQSKKKQIEVLYFKADLACCKAKSCNMLQSDVDSIVVKYFAKDNAKFKVVRIADEANKGLVEKYSAKSQTVVVLKKKGKKESFLDVSDVVQAYLADKDKGKFEETMKTKIADFIK
ncbi:MAG: hypothetical protein A2W91_09390 [Bacteroidetes bacterium GWF2_38_335]|nr:MAG: hypothetical protein A2W91_09390 [Bacteroidetes bacterium GWF2_38_335]OFY80818.1 MAG: hypothetical protein A2281_09110 [Bacteroidetes bacterium RIFOXYA12_FULL_38_20]HBS86219.1 hypothetical protein [Bacteroidales bacterium]